MSPLRATPTPVYAIRVVEGTDNSIELPTFVDRSNNPISFSGYTGWQIESEISLTVRTNGDLVIIELSAEAAVNLPATFGYRVTARNVEGDIVAIVRATGCVVEKALS